jgi:hypothetical protein
VSRNFRARLPRQLDQQLTELCEATRLPTATAIKRCVAYVLAHPEAWDIFQAPYSLVDSRTPQQQQAWQEYAQELERFDMGTILRERGLA